MVKATNSDQEFRPSLLLSRLYIWCFLAACLFFLTCSRRFQSQTAQPPHRCFPLMFKLFYMRVSAVACCFSIAEGLTLNLVRFVGHACL